MACLGGGVLNGCLYIVILQESADTQAQRSQALTHFHSFMFVGKRNSDQSICASKTYRTSWTVWKCEWERYPPPSCSLLLSKPPPSVPISQLEQICPISGSKEALFPDYRITSRTGFNLRDEKPLTEHNYVHSQVSVPHLRSQNNVFVSKIS